MRSEDLAGTVRALVAPGKGILVADESHTTIAHLNAMNAAGAVHPWPLGFSYARALQAPALKVWRGEARHVTAAQEAFLHRARCNSVARDGRYTAELEQASGGTAGLRRP
jgi:fructose-bisphosphate aldolase class I